jgi:uncharacterized RDD family membrane protein YckC
MSEAPESGAGSVAGIGTRITAFLVDSVAANLVAGVVFVAGWHPGALRGWIVYGVFLLIELLFVSLGGQTPGMRVVGAIVVRANDRGRATPGWVAVRTLLLAFVLPAVIVDVSGRAMHDRAAGTVMLRTR